MDTQTGQGIRSLFVVDTGASWIRSFLHAMPSDVRIHGFRVRSTFSFSDGLREAFQKARQCEKASESWDDLWVSVPSWHRAFALSSWLVTRQMRKTIRSFGQPDVILFTLPWYAKVAETFSGVTKVYYAFDPYQFYGWDNNKVIPLEKRILRNCQVGFAVSRLLVEDLQHLTTTTVRYLPNATSWLPGEVIAEAATAAANDLESVLRPRVGCIGQINSSAYDWELIEHLTTSFPSVHFVFIGPRFKEQSSSAVNRIEAVLARPNVHWLGPKPHALLPAYLRCFDVCINPLCVNEHNHRRSPLRLFDFLTTDRPIVSTAIAEAFNHLPFVSIAKDKQEFRRLLGEALKMKAAADLRRRRAYIAANTWHARADEFWQRVGLKSEQSTGFCR